MQGIASGITIMIGYGIGVGIQALWRYLEIPTPRGERAGSAGILRGSGRVAVGPGVWQYVGWQNEVRELFDKEPISPRHWPVIVLVTVAGGGPDPDRGPVPAGALRQRDGWLGRRLPPRLA